MTTLTLDQFLDTLKAQGVPTEHLAFKCPVCATVQSGADLIRAGAGADFDAIEPYLGFSCIGRWTSAGPYTKDSPAGRGCDWTLGGLFAIHKLAVLAPDGKVHPRFEPATPEEAQSHMRENLETAEVG